MQEEKHILIGSGFAFLDKTLFTTYHFEPSSEPQAPTPPEDDPDLPTFEISLTALIETLQIFGFADTKDRWSARDAYSSSINTSYARSAATAFDNRTLGMTGICRITYSEVGSPLCITLEEGNVTTTCDLATFETEMSEDIPFNRDQLVQKIIMRAPLLYDAIVELSATSPERLQLTTSPSAPFFALSAVGSLGSASVEFSKDPNLLETFQVSRKTTNSYKFSMVKSAAKAMVAATKVSIRGDDQGVLSLQFMIEVENTNGVGVSFIDFRFVPFLAEDNEDGDEDGEGSESEHGNEISSEAES